MSDHATVVIIFQVASYGRLLTNTNVPDLYDCMDSYV